jgi:hypothetical protein
MVCVKDNMRIRVSMKMMNDRREWKKKTCADPTHHLQGDDDDGDFI